MRNVAALAATACEAHSAHPVSLCMTAQGTHGKRSPVVHALGSFPGTAYCARSLKSTGLPLHCARTAPSVSLSMGPARTMKFQNPGSSVSGRITYAYITCAEESANKSTSPCAPTKVSKAPRSDFGFVSAELTFPLIEREREPTPFASRANLASLACESSRSIRRASRAARALCSADCASRAARYPAKARRLGRFRNTALSPAAVPAVSAARSGVTPRRLHS